MNVRRLLHRFVLMNAFEGEGAGGGASEVVAPVSDVAAPVADAPAAPEAPKTMHEAMFGKEPSTEPQQGQPRDEAGRFAAKQAADAAAALAATQPGAVVKPAEVVKPGEEDLAMPDGLAPKAQQRFQALANEVKELRPLRERADMLERQTSYVKETFSTHGIKQEQFEQAAGVIGMLNRGDYEGAQRVMMEQLQQIALITGKPVDTAAADPLQNFPDLRQAVDQMQVTEAHALEIAKARFQQHQGQQAYQRTQEQQQTQQQAQQAADHALSEVDAFCSQMKNSDLDYSIIESKLLPEIKNLIAGVPPQQWKRVVETQYRLIKSVAGQFRQSNPASAGNVLRPTGSGSAVAAPKTAFEAMWGKAAPSA